MPIAVAGEIVLGIAAAGIATSVRRETAVVTGNVTHVSIEDGLEIQPAISPDGKLLVYAAGTSMHVRLFLRPVDGGHAVPAGSDQVKARYIRRTPTDPQVQDVRWSPDSRSIYFNSHDGDGRAMFWSLPLDGGPPRAVARLDDLSRPSYRPEFAIGGQRLFFTINDRQSDISVVELIDK